MLGSCLAPCLKIGSSQHLVPLATVEVVASKVVHSEVNFTLRTTYPSEFHPSCRKTLVITGSTRMESPVLAQMTQSRLSRYLVQEGDIVYSRRGDVERRALVRGAEEGWLCGTGCLRVRLGEGGVDPRYASYFLGHPSVREWIVRHAHGATMQNLNTSILSACPFVVPPKEEQRVTAHILGTLDDRIELNRRMNETLEAMVRALFKSWFVDFDPVRAKMEGPRSRPAQTPRRPLPRLPCRFRSRRDLRRVACMGWPTISHS